MEVRGQVCTSLSQVLQSALMLACAQILMLLDQAHGAAAGHGGREGKARGNHVSRHAIAGLQLRTNRSAAVVMLQPQDCWSAQNLGYCTFSALTGHQETPVASGKVAQQVCSEQTSGPSRQEDQQLLSLFQGPQQGPRQQPAVQALPAGQAQHRHPGLRLLGGLLAAFLPQRARQHSAQAVPYLQRRPRPLKMWRWWEAQQRAGHLQMSCLYITTRCGKQGESAVVVWWWCIALRD